MIRIDAVIALVAEDAGVTVQQLKGPSARRPLVRARQRAVYVLRRTCPDISLGLIGEHLGGRDNTTMTHSHQVVQKRIDDGDLDELDTVLDLVRRARAMDSAVRDIAEVGRRAVEAFQAEVTALQRRRLNELMEVR